MNYLKDTEYVLKITGEITESKEDQMIWEYIQKNNLENKVIFTGFKHGKELKELISRSTCIVCPAIWYENMPNTVVEAYAYGKPVIASKVGSLAEIVEDGKTGYLFNMKDAEDLARKLYQYIENNNLCKQMGIAARQKCEKEYCTEAHMNRVIKLLGDCL